MALNYVWLYLQRRIFIEDKIFELWTILENLTDMDSNHDSPIVLYHFALV